jgi:hypothetical protein
MLARNVCFEDITNAVNRVDKLGLKRIVPLRTQPAHDDIDNVSIGFEWSSRIRGHLRMIANVTALLLRYLKHALSHSRSKS